ncbi:MAG: hypothetical protein AMJ77_06850 [Dehalococcoidia bacterium SM23_28_2]|nr:MAG: hypothetical protein AMJ77_06850 [Dehalococcoidia bacterium SM23_28_2]
MLLKKVRLESFKKFRELERDFGPGVNVVKGPLNETGKSTLLDGIVAAFFDNPKSTSKELETYTSWGSSRRCSTAVEFEADGRAYLLEKDFHQRTMRLAALDTGEEWRTPAEVAGILRSLLGTDSSALFLSTSCVRQDEVADIQSGKREIGESLEAIVTGGTEDTVASQVVAALDKRIAALNKGLEMPAKLPGPIARLQQQLASLQQQLVQVKEEVARVEQQKLELLEVSGRLAAVASDLAYSEALLDKNKRLREIEKNIAALEKSYADIDALIRGIESLQRQVGDADSALEAITGFGDAPRVVQVKEQLLELEANRRTIADDLPQRRQELDDAQERLHERRLLAGLASRTGLILGALLSVAGFVGMLFHTASLAAAIVGLLILVAAMWARSRLAQHRALIAGLHERIERMEKGLEEAQTQQRDVLSRVDCSSLEEFRQKETRHSALLEQQASARNQLRGRLGDRTLEDIEGDRRTAARTLAEEREKLTDDLHSTRLSPEEYVKLENKVQDLRAARTDLERREMRCQAAISNARSNPEDLARLEERLEGLDNALEREQRRARVYGLARDFVSRARTEVLVSANDVLQTQIQENFRVFTNGKYKQVRLGEGSLDFLVYSDEKGDWARPDELSGGAIDEFYLACRLALVRLVFGERQPPLILDDPFANFDQPRLAGTLDFLAGLSKEQQVIVFTLGDAFDAIADRVIDLD